MGTILILSLGTLVLKQNKCVGNTIMKVIILLCAVVAAVTANTCQDQKNVVDKLANEASKHYPPGTKGDGVCEDGEGFGCIGEVTSAIASCVLQGHFDGAALFACLQEIISAAGDCYDCICWAMSYLGYNCPEF